METFAIADTFTLPATQALGFSNLLLTRFNSPGTLSISASISPTDSIAPPAVRPTLHRAVPRTCPRKKRRTRRRSQTGDSNDGDENGFYGDDGNDGSFGGSGSGGGGGRGWNSDGYGGADWDESSSSSFSDPAFDFVYQISIYYSTASDFMLQGRVIFWFLCVGGSVFMSWLGSADVKPLHA